MKRNRVLLAILFAAIVFRLFLFILLAPWDEQSFLADLEFADAYEYRALALKFLDSGFKNFGTVRTPVYPLFVAFFYYLFGIDKTWLIFLFQILLDTATVWMIYLISREITRRVWVGYGAAILYSTSFLPALYSNRLTTEVVFTFLFTLSIYLLIRAFKSDIRIYHLAALSAFFLGLATLTRPITQYLPFLLVLFLPLVPLEIVRPRRTRILMGLVFLLVFLSVLFPWQMRNKLAYDHYALSSIQGVNFCSYNISGLKIHVEGISKAEATRQLCLKEEITNLENDFAISKAMQKSALSYMFKHLPGYFYLHFKGDLVMMLGVGRSDIMLFFDQEPEKPLELLKGGLASRIIRELKDSSRQYFLVPLLALRQVLEYFLFLVGIFVLLKDKSKRGYGFLFLFVLIYFLAVVGFVGYSRYRIPLMPFYLIPAATGLWYIINKKLRILKI